MTQLYLALFLAGLSGGCIAWALALWAAGAESRLVRSRHLG